MNRKNAFSMVIVLAVALIPDFAFTQSISAEGAAVVGVPGVGDSLLTLNSERPWIFRQFDTGPSTALELYSTVGQKNFIINTTGNVGIGLTSHPTAKLHVGGNITMLGERFTFGSAEYIEDGGGFIISCNGALVSTADGTDDLGSSTKRWRIVYAATGVINTSDRRDKDNIQDLRYGLQDLLKLRPVEYEWRDNRIEGKKLGLIAQEVDKVIPEVVAKYEYKRNETSRSIEKTSVSRLGLYYSDLIPVLIKSIQEQQLIIQDLSIKITQLQEENNANETLSERVGNLEKILEQKHLQIDP